MSGRAIWNRIKDAQNHRAALYLVWAQTETNGDEYVKLLRRAWSAAGFQFIMTFGDFRLALENLWEEEMRERVTEIDDVCAE